MVFNVLCIKSKISLGALRIPLPLKNHYFSNKTAADGRALGYGLLLILTLILTGYWLLGKGEF